jgi:type 1 fimbria pilin
MKSIKKIPLAVLVYFAGALLLMLSQSAASKCSWSPGRPGEVTGNVNFGTVIVQRDSPIGTLLKSATTGAFVSGGNLYGCDTPWVSRGDMSLFPTLSSYGNNVYATNIAGIGIRVLSYSKRPFPFTSNALANTHLAIPAPGNTVELIKTSAGAVGAGVLTIGTVGRQSISGSSSFGASTALAGVNTIIPVACSITNLVINVGLDPAKLADFKGVGSTAKPKDFPINLNCDAGTKVFMTLEGSRAGPAGVLAPENMATGVGIQLLRDNLPVALGTPLDFGVVTRAGLTTLTLTARYYQIAKTATGGEIKAAATFTLTFN